MGRLPRVYGVAAAEYMAAGANSCETSEPGQRTLDSRGPRCLCLIGGRISRACTQEAAVGILHRSRRKQLH